MNNPELVNSTGNEGFALVLSLLFTGLILLIIVSTTASVVTGSRQGGVHERQAYQALLVAESGLNTLPRQAAEFVRVTPYPGGLTADLQLWLTGLQGALAASNPAVGDTVALTAQSGTTFTAHSTGVNLAAKKITLQDYTISPRTLPPGLRPNSGLTARPRILAGGSATIIPSLVSTVTTISGSPTVGSAQTAITVASAAGLKAGDYVTAGSTTLRIDAVSGTTLTVTRVLPTGTTITTLSGSLSLLLNAAAETPPLISNTMSLKVSNVTDFSNNEVVTVGQGAAARNAVVNAIDASTGRVTISWVAGAPTSIAEGTPVSRTITAMASASNVSIDPSARNKLNNFQGISAGTVVNDCTTNSTCIGTDNATLAAASGSLFTQLLFGLTDFELNDLVPLTAAPSSPLANNTNVGILRIRAADYSRFFASSKNYSGVVIIDDDLAANVNGSTFTGFLYFRGGMSGKFNGSMVVNGGIAVNGDPNTTTNVLSGNVSINYNPVALRLAMTTAGGSMRVDAVAGTWRQQ